MRRGMMALAVMLLGCEAEIPDGRLLCETAAPDCPGGFVCCASDPSGEYDGRCFRGEVCPAIDAGAGMDAGVDGGAAPDAGGDGGTVDGGPPDAGSGDPRPVDVTVGGAHSCVLLDDGTMRCWGDNNEGQLGTGATSTMAQTTPRAVSGLPSGVLAIDAAHDATCARTATDIHCWGSGRGAVGLGVGVLGQPGVTRSPVPIEVMLGDSPAHGFDMGGWFGCAIVGADRHLECWGDNDNGQLGIGTTTDQEVPQTVPGLGGVVDVCAGWSHACAVLEDGSVRCWGNNQWGQLGNGTSGMDAGEPSPVEVPGLSGVADIECGAQHTCAIAIGGSGAELRCWGENSSGEVGQDFGSVTAVESPTRVDSVSPLEPTVLVAGGRFNLLAQNDGITCVASTTEALRCFGSNSAGFLGIGAGLPGRSFMPMTVVNLRTNVIDAAAHAAHACAIDEQAGTRRILCWGQGNRGQLGNADSSSSNAPVPVFGFEGDD